MKVTIDGITYEGTVDEIRDIVRNPPSRSTEIPPLNFPKDDGDNTHHHKRDRHFREWDDGERYKLNDPTMPFTTSPSPSPSVWPNDFPRNWDGSPSVTCYTKNA